MSAWNRANRVTLAFALIGMTTGVLAALVRSSTCPRKGIADSVAADTEASPEELATNALRDDSRAVSVPRATPNGSSALQSNAYDGAAGSGAVRPILQTDPTAPGYDANKLSDVMDIGFHDLFLREPVDSEWAPSMEERIKSLATQDLFTGGINAQIDSVRCHTQICLVVMSAPDSHSLESAGIMFSISNPAPVRAAGPTNGELISSTWCVFPPKFRSLEANEKVYRRYRMGTLAQLRQMPPEELPPNMPPIPEF